MDTALPTQSHGLGESPSRSFGRLLVDALRFWEPRRVVYDLILAIVVVVWIVASWPHFRPMFTPHGLLLLVILALLANACYCTAYILDIPMQSLFVGDSLRYWRWCLWVIGTLLAVVLANYWIVDEIYPFVR